MASTNGQKTFNFALCVSSEDAEKSKRLLQNMLTG